MEHAGLGGGLLGTSTSTDLKFWLSILWLFGYFLKHSCMCHSMFVACCLRWASSTTSCRGPPMHSIIIWNLTEPWCATWSEALHPINHSNLARSRCCCHTTWQGADIADAVAWEWASQTCQDPQKLQQWEVYSDSCDITFDANCDLFRVKHDCVLTQRLWFLLVQKSVANRAFIGNASMTWPSWWLQTSSWKPLHKYKLQIQKQSMFRSVDYFMTIRSMKFNLASNKMRSTHFKTP